MTKQEAIQTQIDEIIDTFPFEKVRQWMEHCNWRWINGVPELSEIRKEAWDQINKAVACNGWSYGGGFAAQLVVRMCPYEKRPFIRIDLSFGYTSLQDGTSYTP